MSLNPSAATNHAVESKTVATKHSDNRTLNILLYIYIKETNSAASHEEFFQEKRQPPQRRRVWIKEFIRHTK